MREQIQQAIDLRDAVVTCFISGDGGELGCDVGRLYDLIDAALRRAKAEGRIKSMWEAVHIANTYNCDHNHGKKATEAVDNVLLKLYDRIAELEADARAAQIEEGE